LAPSQLPLREKAKAGISRGKKMSPLVASAAERQKEKIRLTGKTATRESTDYRRGGVKGPISLKDKEF